MQSGTPNPSADPRNPDPSAAVSRRVFDDKAIRRALMRISHEILERNEDPNGLYLVAIPNGGVPLARQLRANLGDIADVDAPLGILDTTLYRDDLATRAERPLLRDTEMPSGVDGKDVILVDDVVKTGRTIRAAMDALMDFGRPRTVQLVGLVDRGHRELPIKLDYVGKNVPTAGAEEVRLRRVDSPDEVRGAPEASTSLEGGVSEFATNGDEASLGGVLELVVLRHEGRGDS